MLIERIFDEIQSKCFIKLKAFKRPLDCLGELSFLASVSRFQDEHILERIPGNAHVRWFLLSFCQSYEDAGECQQLHFDNFVDAGRTSSNQQKS